MYAVVLYCTISCRNTYEKIDRLTANFILLSFLCISGEFTRLHESSHFMTCNPDEIVKKYIFSNGNFP